MTLGRLRFGDFTFDPAERSLTRGGERLDLGGRYLDALGLLLRERGKLVTKNRFMDEVWNGVPVTDEALTQCIRALRRELGDDAARPRFIETVPKYGYRFIAEAQWAGVEGTAPAKPRGFDLHQVLRTAGAAGLGGALAGVGGGLLYGFAVSPASPAQGMGAISVLLVLLAINVLIGLVAGLGVGGGIAVARLMPSDRWQWSTAGGMVGGLAIGGIAKLLGLDAFALLFGASPSGMTGPAEGALLGAALGFATWISVDRQLEFGGSAAVGGLAGGAAGLLVPLLGGHLLGGSLNLLAHGFAGARFRLDAIGALLGEEGFGRVSEALTATIEGGLFGICVAGALALGRSRGHGDRVIE
ncbi:transcriptional regulator [Sphingomonas cannabina]|uniref:winged helix-turn-helix domain-containing protein n=1 Tax=Sphingomonas cannabina TaxID=2899123 RepID=UPI001F3FBD70|nr:transcriptional regulator [Sphingomonas cannabina]UIJ44398.1 transcriptional regulator [Sphingomonas cannabina]